ncbi:MAG TPA: hypothetical protein VFV10_14575, partial [Gammaproteobacteria bacterium]|nr:hypothetical protein [Gammaproteobacteria bacterium]
SDMDEIRKDVAAIARSLKEMGGAKKQEALARATELGDRARQRAGEAEQRLEQEIEERPFASVLTAFGIGFLLGKIFD